MIIVAILLICLMCRYPTLYADDLILMSTSMEGLNKCLEKLKSYCNTWQMEVNLKKSQVIVFNSAGRLLTGYNFFYGGKKVRAS